MNVLITGSSGFLGQHFLFEVERRGHRPLGIDIRPDPVNDGLHGFIQQDVVEWFEDRNTFDPRGDVSTNRYDLVIHMAGVVGGRVRIEHDPMYNADQLRIDSALFRWAVRHANAVIYPSSSAVYGVALQRMDAMPLHESMFHPATDTWLAPDEIYGLCKMAGERLALSAVKYGLNTLCIRPFSGYGEGQSLDYPVPSIADRALAGESPLTVWGPGSQTRDFIHVSDLVSAAMARYDAGITGYEAMNVGTGTETSFNEVAAICADLAGYRPEIVNLGDKPSGVYRRFCDPTRMLKYYTPQVTLREGLMRVMQSLRSVIA